MSVKARVDGLDDVWYYPEIEDGHDSGSLIVTVTFRRVYDVLDIVTRKISRRDQMTYGKKETVGEAIREMVADFAEEHTPKPPRMGTRTHP